MYFNSPRIVFGNLFNKHLEVKLHIRGIRVKNTPFYKKPPLVSPRSETRGGS